jgi:hypothetical protein
MNHLTIAPMQWTRVEDLHDTEPLSQADVECMKDLRAVLARHGRLGRFALHLIHKHFEIADDEVLVEYSEAANREQFFRVEKASSEVARHAIPTTWTLEHLEPTARCVCAWRATHGHLGRHETGVFDQEAPSPSAGAA